MSDKIFCEDDILRVLSEEWHSFEQIVTGLDVKEEYSRRWLALKLKNLEKSGEIKVDSISGIKFWKKDELLEINPDYEFQIKKYEGLLEDFSNQYQALYELAKIYEEKGEYKKAIKYFRKCIALNYNEPDANFGLIRTYYNSGDLSNAYKLLKKQKQFTFIHSSLSSKVLADVGYYYLKGDNEDKAVEMFEKAIKSDFENDEAYYEIGIIQFKRNNFQEAADNFRAALEFTGEEIPIEQEIKRWTCYIYAMQEIDSLDEALDLFELALTSANFEIEYWESLVDMYIKFDICQRGYLFLDNFIRNGIDEKEFYNDHNKKAIINLQNLFLENYLNKTVQEALSFYFSVSSDCSLKDLQDYIHEKQSLLVIEDKDLKFKVIELIQKFQLPIMIQEGKFHSTNSKYSQSIQLKHGNELSIKNYIGNLVQHLLPAPTNRNIKKFAQEVGIFTENFSEYEKYIAFREVRLRLKAWDKLKPPIWKKIVKAVVKFLPGLSFSFK